MEGPRVTSLDLQRYLDGIMRISSETDNKLRIEAENQLLSQTDSAGFIELLKALFSEDYATKTPDGRQGNSKSDKNGNSISLCDLHQEEHQELQVRTTRVPVRCSHQNSVQSLMSTKSR